MEKNRRECVVLVTGASSGIGKTVAIHLSKRGYRVFGASRSAMTGEMTEGVESLRMDVTSEDEVMNGIDYIISRTGRLDAIINNAGLGMMGPIESTSDPEAREIFDTNFFGVLNVCRASLPHLRRSGCGYIINITSLAAQMGLPFRGIYCASKFAVEGFTESLSQEVRAFGIKTVIIEPGDFRTNINTTRRHASHVDPVYKGSYDTVVDQVCREVGKAPEPEAIALRIERILDNGHPELRYRVANLMQRFSLTLMRILPGRWFEYLVMRHYKMRR